MLQRAVVMVLEAIYEQDFKDCSYGFRPGRSAHQALESLWQQTMATGGGGIPTYEDKILQRAVLLVLEPVYETDFLDVSHGFRPGRGAHGALHVAVEAGDEVGRRLDRGRRSAKILRYDRPRPSPGVPQASGARWCDPATDRQMA